MQWILSIVFYEIQVTIRISMPKVPFRIEDIRTPPPLVLQRALQKRFRHATDVKSRAWVAQINLNPNKKIERLFLRPNTDYLKSNTKGTRGVYRYYWLEEGKIYEISMPLSWHKTDRFFARIDGGKLIRISSNEVR